MYKFLDAIQIELQKRYAFSIAIVWLAKPCNYLCASLSGLYQLKLPRYNRETPERIPNPDSNDGHSKRS